MFLRNSQIISVGLGDKRTIGVRPRPLGYEISCEANIHPLPKISKSIFIVFCFTSRTNNYPWSGKFFRQQLLATPASRLFVCFWLIAIYIGISNHYGSSLITSKLQVNKILLLLSLSSTAGTESASTRR